MNPRHDPRSGMYPSAPPRTPPPNPPMPPYGYYQNHHIPYQQGYGVNSYPHGVNSYPQPPFPMYHQANMGPPPPPHPPGGRLPESARPRDRRGDRYFNHPPPPVRPSSKAVTEKTRKTPKDIQADLIAMKPSYVQCTQHSQYYKRITDDASSIEASSKLCDLLKLFQRELASRHAKLWVPNDYVKFQRVESDDQYTTRALVDEIKFCTSEHKSLPRHKKIRAVMLIRKLQKEAMEAEQSLADFITTDKPSLPLFAVPKLKELMISGETNCSVLNCDVDDEEYSAEKAGELIASIRKLKDHEKRLHDELWYNDPLQVNDGPLCRCSELAKQKGIRHNVYPGEEPPISWNCHRNNSKKLYNYVVMIVPTVNFTSEQPTTIRFDGRDYVFEGFSILSSEPLDKLPFCDIIRFHTRYTIYLVEETTPENFCARGLQLFAEIGRAHV